VSYDKQKLLASIGRFTQICQNIGKKPHYSVQELAPQIFSITPLSYSSRLQEGKSLALTFGALIHGNEVVGVKIITNFLETLLDESIQLSLPIGVFLGNIAAAKVGKRYLEKDLNRSFSSKNPQKLEEKRAGEIEKLLKKTTFFLDFHQTIRKTRTPFFSFPYQKEGVYFASSIAPTTPILTHWGRPFSKDGLCSDYFVSQQKGTGITLELGQAGFSSLQEVLGGKIMLRAIDIVYAALNNQKLSEIATLDNTFYTWKHIEPYNSINPTKLVKDLNNFDFIEKGSLIGYKGQAEVYSQEEGFLMFPYYPSPLLSHAPKELYRLIKQISKENLPS